ncbi:MAG: LysR family transcriptional regulator [Clostridiales bacterium]|nr:LysR family transcriptional regulator [Clostridiales bacterium]
MEIRNLTTFVQAAEAGSMTRAAQALSYSQSTVSFQIKQLETELGCMLFERIGHRLTLTQKGEELLLYAQKVLRLTDEFHETLSAGGDVTGHVHIVTPDSVCECMLLDNYADFYRRYPGITLKFSTANTEDMMRMVTHNEADVMMTLDSHVYRSDLSIAKEARMSVHFVTGAGSPLRGKQLAFRDIAQMPFILTERGMGYRRVLEERLAQMNYEVQPVLEVGRTDVITHLLEGGSAISYLPDFITRRGVEAGKLCYLDVCDVQADIWQQLIFHRSKWMSRALDTFIRYVMENEFGR